LIISAGTICCSEQQKRLLSLYDISPNRFSEFLPVGYDVQQIVSKLESATKVEAESNQCGDLAWAPITDAGTQLCRQGK
jgi:hypothetical protein